MRQTTFFDLLRESVIVQGILAIIVIGGTFALILAGRPVDERVWMIDTAVLGFFFGAKGLTNVRATASEATQIIAALAGELARGAADARRAGAATSRAASNPQRSAAAFDLANPTHHPPSAIQSRLAESRLRVTSRKNSVKGAGRSKK